MRSIRRRAEKIQKDAEGLHKTLENDKLRRQQIQHTSLIINSINERPEQHLILRVEHANERRRQQDTNSSQSHTIVDQHEHESAEHVDLRAADPLEELGRIQRPTRVEDRGRAEDHREAHRRAQAASRHHLFAWPTRLYILHVHSVC